ncbi:MAG TPA: SHOCT domain-containing protein [Propionibacteriaceae bacterium]|nr:SHOCT domain-containing protein [Propionibacteriaceae bacterium]
MAKKHADALEQYSVAYRGGLPNLPKAKSGSIDLVVTPDAFVFEPTIGSKFWAPLTIPYSRVRTFAVVPRQVSTVESLLGGMNSRQLNQDNNLNIEFEDASGAVLVLRVEMLTGITVMGQAGKCRELMDRLRVHGILDRFAGAPSSSAAPSVAARLAQLGALHKAGVLSDDEFASKRAEIIAAL